MPFHHIKLLDLVSWTQKMRQSWLIFCQSDKLLGQVPGWANTKFWWYFCENKTGLQTRHYLRNNNLRISKSICQIARNAINSTPTEVRANFNMLYQYWINMVFMPSITFNSLFCSILSLDFGIWGCHIMICTDKFTISWNIKSYLVRCPLHIILYPSALGTIL